MAKKLSAYQADVLRATVHTCLIVCCDEVHANECERVLNERSRDYRWLQIRHATWRSLEKQGLVTIRRQDGIMVTPTEAGKSVKIHGSVSPAGMGPGWKDNAQAAKALAAYLEQIYRRDYPTATVYIAVDRENDYIAALGSWLSPETTQAIQQTYAETREAWPYTAAARAYAHTPHEIVTDGTTVWINGGQGLIARFGVRGIDIHRPASEQHAGECLYCTHDQTTADDWDLFVAKVFEYFQIRIGSSHKPVRFRP